MRWALGALVALGCGVADEADYVASRAAAECARLEACALGYFESEYAGGDDCVHERSEELEEANDRLSESCDFVVDEAGPCVRRIRGLRCEEVVEGRWDTACDLVWRCGDLGLPTYGETTYTVIVDGTP